MIQKSYYFEGINTQGTIIKGTLEYAKIWDLKLALSKKNIFPLKIKRKFTFIRNQKISPKLITSFSRQLSTLINAGIPLISAFSILEQSTKHTHLLQLIKNLHKAIENGKTLSGALIQHPQYFDTLFSGLVQTGEQSGTLDIILDRIANHREKIENLKRKIKKALLYPISIMLIAFSVTMLMLTFVIPKFAELYQSFGKELPPYTKLIIGLARQSKIFSLIFLIFLTSICFCINISKQKSDKFAFQLDQIILHIPIFGMLIKKTILARFTYTLALTLKAGLSILDAITIVSGITKNLIFQKAISTIHKRIMNGESISNSLKQHAIFPVHVVQMVAIGEESGALDLMLFKIAEHYENEINCVVDNLSTLLEPAIMIILGIVIGGLIIGMYLPIFKLGNIM